MLRPVLLLSLCVFGVCAAEIGIVDMPVRYINRDMITYQDLQERVVLGLRLKKAQPPKDTKGKERLLAEALEMLTEEILLIQEAERMGIEYPLHVIQADVRKDLEEQEQVPDPRTMAELVRQRQRTIKIQTILRHYLEMTPAIRPEDIEEYFEKNQDNYRRPARWHLYQIMMLPSDNEDRKKIFDKLTAIFRAIIASDDEKINALINDEITQEFLKLNAGSIEQIQFLNAIAKQLLALGIEDPGPVTRVLIEEAQRWTVAADAMRDKEAVIALMDKIKVEISALEADQRLAVFQKYADLYSVGLGNGQGGDLGLVELETQNKDFQERMKDLDVYQLSEIFWSGNAAVLLFATTREPAVQRTFNEVNGEIRKSLEHQQKQAVRQDLLNQLKSQAAIIDAK